MDATNIKHNITKILHPKPQTCIYKANKPGSTHTHSHKHTRAYICPHVWGVGAGTVHSKTAGENRVCSGCEKEQIQVTSVPPVAAQ